MVYEYVKRLAESQIPDFLHAAMVYEYVKRLAEPRMPKQQQFDRYRRFRRKEKP